MIRTAAVTLILVPLVASAYSAGTTLGGTTTTINAGAGNQTSPHVDGTLAAYTSAAGSAFEIRYFNFSTSSDQGIPTVAGAFDYLSDVSGTRVVFDRIEGAKSGVWVFNTATAGPAVELAPDPAAIRSGATIGGSTVAWQDLGFGPGLSEIVAYDLGAGVAVRVTNDTRNDRNVAVSSGGSVLAWEACDASYTTCDIWQAVKGTSGWTTTQVTNTPESESLPDTNGTLVVYGATRAASVTGADIYWTPVAGGAEVQLALAGDQRNPNISGNLIAFESRNAADATPNWDIFIYDTSTTTLYRLTNTTTLDETLNDISVVSNQVRVVFSVLEADQNVYGYTFNLAPVVTPPPGSCGGSGYHDDDHDDHGHHDYDGDGCERNSSRVRNAKACRQFRHH